MLRRNKYFAPFSVGIASLASFIFAFLIFPIFYDVDYTNRNPSRLWDNVHSIVVGGGFLLSVVSLIWVILLLCKIRSSIALAIGLTFAAVIYYLTVIYYP
jgi:ABC-type Fe3+-siderophore transport system permease subunit